VNLGRRPARPPAFIAFKPFRFGLKALKLSAHPPRAANQSKGFRGRESHLTPLPTYLEELRREI